MFATLVTGAVNLQHNFFTYIQISKASRVAHGENLLAFNVAKF